MLNKLSKFAAANADILSDIIVYSVSSNADI